MELSVKLSVIFSDIFRQAAVAIGMPNTSHNSGAVATSPGAAATSPEAHSADSAGMCSLQSTATPQCIPLFNIQTHHKDICSEPACNGTDKKTSFAAQSKVCCCEMMSNLIVLNAGLDARAAAIVMRTVRNTVNTGRTVVCTIHQPSIDIFEASSILLFFICIYATAQLTCIVPSASLP